MKDEGMKRPLVVAVYAILAAVCTSVAAGGFIDHIVFAATTFSGMAVVFALMMLAEVIATAAEYLKSKSPTDAELTEGK
ncbi:MAG TPA: hypothetical protein VLF67_02870 [Candidatus Saccharimonas sp.]|nr:hypothetical protein [Candidatus Saccharimonas sp.]